MCLYVYHTNTLIPQHIDPHLFRVMNSSSLLTLNTCIMNQPRTFIVMPNGLVVTDRKEAIKLKKQSN